MRFQASPTTTAGAPLFKRLLHRLEQSRRVGRAHEDEPAEIQPVRDEPRPVERARLAQREILGDDEPRRAALGHEARDKRQRETHRRRAVAGARRRDLVQGVAGKPAAERAVERAGQRQPGSRRARLRRPRRASISATARRKRAIPSALSPRDIRSAPYVRYLF